MQTIKQLYSKLRKAWPVNRVVTALTPLISLISGAVAGAVVSWVAAHVPGLPPIDPNWLAGIFTAAAVSGAASVTLIFRKFLDGHINYEQMLADPNLKPFETLPTATSQGELAHTPTAPPPPAEAPPPAPA